MSVLTGPREEWRRILHEGAPVWVRPEGDRLRLGDGRMVVEASAIYLPPCDPTKIICIHLNYESRRVEFKAPGVKGAGLFHETADHAEFASRLSEPSRQLPVSEL